MGGVSPVQVSLSPGMSVGDRIPGLPKRRSRLSGPFGSAEAAASTGSFTSTEIGLKVCQSFCVAPWHLSDTTCVQMPSFLGHSFFLTCVARSTAIHGDNEVSKVTVNFTQAVSMDMGTSCVHINGGGQVNLAAQAS